jgi:hypothetical protein
MTARTSRAGKKDMTTELHDIWLASTRIEDKLEILLTATLIWLGFNFVKDFIKGIRQYSH